jgi:tetratricopeptide (TPR) repeat protein
MSALERGRINVKTIFAAKWGGRLAALVLGLASVATPAVAQGGGAIPAGNPATVHGVVRNPAGFVVTKGDVKFSLTVAGSKPAEPKDLTYQHSYPIDANGTYKGADLPPGSYVAVVWSDGKAADYLPVTVKSGEDKTLDFDMTREEYIKGMSEADRKALEDYKKKNAGVAADNAKIQNINAVLKQALDDQKSGKPDEAVTALQGVMTLRPDEPVLWQALGQAQLAAGELAAKTAKTDPATIQKFADAATSYQKAIDLSATAAKKPTPEQLGVYYQNMGTALLKSGKIKEGQDAYDASAKANPAGAGNAYYNEAATLFNADKRDDAAVAADKVIAADPKRADAYYIKASGLVQHVTVDDKTKKYVLPPGCTEAYQEYLELAPDGPHAAEVKGILESMGQPIKNSFKASGKKGGL